MSTYADTAEAAAIVTGHIRRNGQRTLQEFSVTYSLKSDLCLYELTSDCYGKEQFWIVENDKRRMSTAAEIYAILFQI